VRTIDHPGPTCVHGYQHPYATPNLGNDCKKILAAD